jgi:glycosyltransferase involved in cell wall biosynthesis
MNTSPTFSILTPVYDPPIWALKRCVDSVLTQKFKDWQWCIVDDCSTRQEVRNYLQKLAKRDDRISLQFSAENQGIVNTSNKCLSMAKGRYVALLDHDDSLHLDALAEVNNVLEDDEHIDFVYTDEDKIDESGRHFDRFLKPDFSPERLRSQNYICHLSVVRTTLMRASGAFREGFDGSQDYDLFLRVSEQARKIVHIPKVLYHWQQVTGSAATTIDAKPYAFEAATKAVKEHCERVGIAAEVTSTSVGYLQTRRTCFPRKRVSIIIPTRGDRKMIWGTPTCLVANSIKSVIQKSTYVDYEIILVHDRTPMIDPDLEPFVALSNVNLQWYDKPFDFSDKCNVGSLAATGDVLIFLNDDTQVITPDWIQILISYLDDEDVAMVGPMLLLEDGRIQSAGHANNPTPHNLGAGQLANDHGPFGAYMITREVSGVTGACMVVRKSDYFEVGGMSLTFPHSFNDIDLAFKFLERNQRIIWTPLAKLYHFESLTRDPSVKQSEFHNISLRWKRFFGRDKYYR